MAKELAKTLKVNVNGNNEEYNINAKTADVATKVANALEVKKIDVDDKTTTGELSFDGSGDSNELVIVPAAGGRFSGRITVPSFPESWSTDGETILNYKDITETVLKELKNNSVLYTWNGTTLSGGGSGTQIKSVSIITGAAGNVNSFAAENATSKQFSAFIYVADTGNIYFGTSDSSEVAGVTVSSETAINANQLTNARKFSVNLGTSDTVDFNGTADAALGVTGTLPFTKGGLGGDISNSSSQAAKTAEYYINGSIGESTAAVTDDTWMLFRHNSPSLTAGQYCRKKASALWTYLASKIRNTFGFNTNNILQPANGGTGVTSLDSMTAGSAKSLTVYTSTGSGATPQATYTARKVIMSTIPPTAADGSNGDIWIKY
jgi:hypothetical protein